MALTSAERKRKYLEKLKATGEHEKFKKNKAASEKMRRDRIKSGLEKLPKAVREKTKRLNRAYKRKKAAEYRRKKKEAEKSNIVPSNVLPSSEVPPSALPSEPSNGFKTKSALDKAVGKIRRSAPSTSDKKIQAVSKYLKTLEADDLEKIVSIVTNKSLNRKAKSTRAVSCDVVEAVKTFFERDDVSRMSPNMRDCKQYVDPVTGLSEAKPIRHLMYKLSDVYDMFVKYVQNGEPTVKPPLKASTFYQLRPENVKLVGCTPLASCFCLYHTNIIMCCDAINRYLPEFPKYGKLFEQTILCDPPQKSCWWRDCEYCANKAQEKFDEILGSSRKKLKTRVVWKQWTKSKQTNRFQKIDVPGTLADLWMYFFNILAEFLKHSYIKRCQEASFQSDSDEARHSNGRIVLVQLDFPESYTCQSQDEIQTAHWNQANV